MNQENNTAWITACKSQQFGYLVNGTMSVPNDPANRHCADVLAWIAAGNVPEPEFSSDEIIASKAADERQWRDAEIARSDIELYKVQDGRGVGNVGQWRAYRNDLRDYPEQAGFPDSARPEFEDV
jgi:hypothetical protein